MSQNKNIDRLPVLHQLSSRLSPILFRELVDCVAGVRVTRFDIPADSIDRAAKWARRLNMKFEFGTEYYRMVIDPGMTNWSSTAKLADPDDEDAFLSMYLSTDADKAVHARQADEADDHETLGKLMSIPECCRKSYVNWLEADNCYIDPIFSVKIPNPRNAIPVCTIPNPFSCYSQSGLISHYPCSVKCNLSTKNAIKSYSRICNFWPQIALELLEKETSLALYVKDKGVALAKSYCKYDDLVRFNTNNLHGQGEIFKAFQESNRIKKYEDGIILYSGIDKIFEARNGDYLCAAFRAAKNMH